ncbi:MAG: class I SAM-dependent methyltransferase [Bacillota bacterium]
MWNQYYQMNLSDEDIFNGKHRDAVGGLWKQLGELQYNFMVQHGLRPENTLLDVGCGSLRGGIYFIRYLNEGRYFGVDINKSLIDAGKIELNNLGLHEKKPVLLVEDHFRFELFKRNFDYAIAQSVFTHLPINVIQRSLINIDKVLNKGGRFYATFFETKNKFTIKELDQGCGIISYLDHDPYHYHISVFEYLIEGLSLRLEYIGSWGHPRNQKMLCFYKI